MAAVQKEVLKSEQRCTPDIRLSAESSQGSADCTKNAGSQSPIAAVDDHWRLRENASGRSCLPEGGHTGPERVTADDETIDGIFEELDFNVSFKEVFYIRVH